MRELKTVRERKGKREKRQIEREARERKSEKKEKEIQGEKTEKRDFLPFCSL